MSIKSLDETPSKETFIEVYIKELFGILFREKLIKYQIPNKKIKTAISLKTKFTIKFT